MIRIRASLLAVLVACGAFGLAAAPARANEDISACDDLAKTPDNVILAVFCLFEFLEKNFGPPISLDSTAAVAVPIAATQQLTNVDATVQPGEPIITGMTRTAWVGFKAPVAARIVIHTFGSKPWDTGVFDPILAVYRGTALSNLHLVAGSDNKPLTGGSRTDSLVQFDTVAGTDYRVQVGSKNNVEGEISLNVFSFPPGGGVSAFLSHVGGNAFSGRDYTCDFYAGPFVTTPCPSAKFIVHNSTDAPLAVAASTSLGLGVTASPASFTLAKGALQAVTFTFGTAFNRTSVRTQSGQFIFTGRVGSTVTTEARQRALVIVRPGARVTDLIQARTSPPVRTAHVNQPVTFTSTVANIGSATAIGCHFRSSDGSSLKSTFYTINPSTGARLTADGLPVSIAPGATRTFNVTIASQGAHDADFIDPEVFPDCANNFRSTTSLRGGFDISTSAVAQPLPSIGITYPSPANGILNVPAGGSAFFTFRATNATTTATLDVLPAYAGFYSDPANTRFSVAICRTSLATGVCLAPYASSVQYTAKTNVTSGFSVRVTAPAGSPVYDPDKRRVLVNFKLAAPPYYHIAVPSIAVRKQ